MTVDPPCLVIEVPLEQSAVARVSSDTWEGQTRLLLNLERRDLHAEVCGAIDKALRALSESLGR